MTKQRPPNQQELDRRHRARRPPVRHEPPGGFPRVGQQTDPDRIRRDIGADEWERIVAGICFHNDREGT
jgi:hypothetical protein